ncbi:hypothetical protein [Reichenbachiella versicolor]|uniref:hypothetical protein n=1 Tax=Reichenbachiella versicolor TaxID=1821036 RepID=UPI000D6DD5B4|nr:hypothetical protein [Reichenbachiella versicolor]
MNKNILKAIGLLVTIGLLSYISTFFVSSKIDYYYQGEKFRLDTEEGFTTEQVSELARLCKGIVPKSSFENRKDYIDYHGECIVRGYGSSHSGDNTEVGHFSFIGIKVPIDRSERVFFYCNPKGTDAYYFVHEILRYKGVNYKFVTKNDSLYIMNHSMTVCLDSIPFDINDLPYQPALTAQL